MRIPIIEKYTMYYNHRWARGGGWRGATPCWKKFLWPPYVAFKTTPTPSEMAFDPLPQILSFLSWRRFFFLEKKFWEKKKFRRLAPAPVFVLQ